MMKVKELIKCLEECPEDVEVLLEDSRGYFTPVSDWEEIDLVSDKKHPNIYWERIRGTSDITGVILI
jgi:hypothetical protein